MIKIIKGLLIQLRDISKYRRHFFQTDIKYRMGKTYFPTPTTHIFLYYMNDKDHNITKGRNLCKTM